MPRWADWCHMAKGGEGLRTAVGETGRDQEPEELSQAMANGVAAVRSMAGSLVE
jgi:hypothetical protein